MSFVFAEKYKASWSESERLDIHCDTRVVKESISGAHFSAKQRSFIEQYRIVKKTAIFFAAFFFIHCYKLNLY